MYNFALHSDSQNKEEGKASDVEVPLSSAFIELPVQLGVQGSGGGEGELFTVFCHHPH